MRLPRPFGPRNDSHLIVALDLPTLREAEVVVKRLKKHVTIFKIGLQLFTREGPKVVQMVQRHGGEVFLDLKFHDIPNTVAQACESATRLGVFMLNVHASGGPEMMRAAAEAVRHAVRKPLLLGVTVLTSDRATAATKRRVVQLARAAQAAGLDGVVCSGHELRAIRRACGQSFVTVVPGIRPATPPKEKLPRWGGMGGRIGILPPKGAKHPAWPVLGGSDDQKRVMTPKEAIDLGANYLVMGRPILESRDPVGKVKDILGGLERMSS